MKITKHQVYVIDASVVAKPCLNEDGSDFVLNLFNLHNRKEITLVAPSLLYYELGNILCRRFPVPEFGRLLGVIDAQKIAIIDLDYLGKNEVAKIMDQYSGATFYDASYYALAKQLKGKLITADHKFAKLINDPHHIIEFNPEEACFSG